MFGPDPARLHSEDVFLPTTVALQAGLPPVAPSPEFRAHLGASLMERAIAMPARRAWYRSRQAMAGFVALGVAATAASAAGVLVVRHRRHDGGRGETASE